MRYSQETIKCDGCGSPVKEPSFIINNGSHQSIFKTIGTKDICNICLGKMFDLYIRDKKLSGDEVLEYLPKIKSLNDRNTVQIGNNSSSDGYNGYNAYKFPFMSVTDVNK